MWSFFKRTALRCLRRGSTASGDWQQQSAARVERLRASGVRIGVDCVVLTESFSTEPWLVELGNRVAVAGGVKFLTHDGAAHFLRRERPDAQSLGRIVVGDDCFVGEDCLLLAGTRIGSGSIVGAGSVVRGPVPDNSLVVGNPGRVVGRASLALARMRLSPDTLDTFRLPPEERRRVIEAHFGLGIAARETSIQEGRR